jgi:hypothetical protein
MAISVEQQDHLRRCYDEGLNKRQATMATGLSEATVYRYYTKWDALSQHDFDLDDLNPVVVRAYKAEAERRGVSVFALVIHCLSVVAVDNIFTALIDIEETNPSKGRLRGPSGT